MNLLLDTHVALFALARPHALGEGSRAMISDFMNTVYFSAASAWEVAIKNAKHPEDMPCTVDEFLDLCRKAGYRELPIRSRHVQALMSIDADPTSPVHSDPFDRMLMSQAESEGMKLLTKDRMMLRYELESITDASV